MNSVIDILDVQKHIQGIEKAQRKHSIDNYFTLDTEENQEEFLSERENLRLPDNWRKQDVFERKRKEKRVEQLPKVKTPALQRRDQELKRKLAIPYPNFEPGKLRKKYQDTPSVWDYNPSHAHRAKASPTLQFRRTVGRELLKKTEPPRRLLDMRYSKKTRSSSDQRSCNGSDFEKYTAQLNRNLQKLEFKIRDSYDTVNSTQNVYGVSYLKQKEQASSLLSIMVKKIKSKHSRFHSLTDLEDIPP